jgi:hypothetical protein
MLDQEPVISVAAAALAVMSHPDQYPASLQLFARERELQVSFAKGAFGISPIIGGPDFNNGTLRLFPGLRWLAWCWI